MSIYDTLDIAVWEDKQMKCCGNCRHYKTGDAYCYLTDELVKECDCCGMYDGGDG